MQWINEANFSDKKLRVGLICFQYRYIENTKYRYQQFGIPIADMLYVINVYMKMQIWLHMAAAVHICIQ